MPPRGPGPGFAVSRFRRARVLPPDYRRRFHHRGVHFERHLLAATGIRSARSLPLFICLSVHTLLLSGATPV